MDKVKISHTVWKSVRDYVRTNIRPFIKDCHLVGNTETTDEWLYRTYAMVYITGAAEFINDEYWHEYGICDQKLFVEFSLKYL